MTETETVERFERALEQSVANGADPDELEAALESMRDRVKQLRVVRGEADAV